MYCSQKQGEDFARFCGLLRIYELYLKDQILKISILYLLPNNMTNPVEKCEWILQRLQCKILEIQISV